MTTPRPHAALMHLWIADDELDCWMYSPPLNGWVFCAYGPIYVDYIYAIGSQPTAPPRKTCTLGGLQFPMPETVAPEVGEYFYLPRSSAYINDWAGSAWQLRCLREGDVHLTEAAASAHCAAKIAANRQAISGAV